MSTTRIGRYEIERELGRGAMAVVYKAVDQVIGRVVAIKTIRLEHGIGLEQEELRQRLYREAQSAGNLNHPNIVTIYDIGEEGDLTYIAMEFIEGVSLEDWMQQNRIPPVEVTASIIEQIASGLDYAAARGIIHRDIKPGNILLTSDMRAKIADFGIAKFSTSKFTQTGAVMGTPAYMSPEQAMGKTLDGRSDIFSLGVIFYEMLTGERPFTGSSSTTIIYKILHEEPAPAHKLNVTLHKGFDYVARRMLAKDPDQRYQACSEVVQDLRNYAKLGSSKGTRLQTTVPGQPGGRPRYGLFALIATLVLAIGVLTVFLYQQSNRKPTLQPVAPPPVAAALSTPAIQRVAEAPAPAAVPENAKPRPREPAAAPVKPAFAQIQIRYSGAAYSASIYDGARKLQDLSSGESILQLPAGDRNFRIVSDEVFLDQAMDRVRLKGDQVFPINLPGLGSAHIEVPNDAYEGCEIALNGRKLPPPYPAQIQKLAAGDHRLTFRWISGKYAGKEFTSSFPSGENHLYRVKGDPQSDRVVVQQVR